ncbi:hypothetical protein [Bradyrhizobium valentinum]|uniref:hypothetical protein n=1 Tax=Bradyrhizobium valentinum TaxID=1518501 RepID=UPI000A4C1777|nr:hypothetical protein [Bradyrhizobium valentinum]
MLLALACCWSSTYPLTKIGVGLSVVLLGESVPANLALGLVLVMAGVAAMTIPSDQYRKWIWPLACEAIRRVRAGDACQFSATGFFEGTSDQL